MEDIEKENSHKSKSEIKKIIKTSRNQIILLVLIFSVMILYLMQKSANRSNDLQLQPLREVTTILAYVVLFCSVFLIISNSLRYFYYRKFVKDSCLNCYYLIKEREGDYCEISIKEPSNKIKCKHWEMKNNEK